MKTADEKHPRPVFAVVGLRFGQEAHVARQCRHLADLKFVRATTAEISFPTSDAVVLLTKFIKHRWTVAAYRAFARERVHLHSGGLSGVIAKIKMLAAAPTTKSCFVAKKRNHLL
jgi:hypothetical protein